MRLFAQSRPAQPNRAVPRLETLEDRLVPAVVDLTTRGTQGIVHDALFRQVDALRSNTLQSIVRLQNHHGRAVEQGYNTDARPLQFDEKRNRKATHSLKLSDVPRVTVDGETYREFRLNINQKSSRPLLSLDELRVYVGDKPDLKGYRASLRQLAGLDPVYDLDAGGDNWVKLNARLNPGHGRGDMAALVPERVFANANADSYVYLYSKFGQHHAANGGFEEWGVRVNPCGDPPPPKEEPPPPPSSLSGYVYLDADENGLRDSSEQGIADVTLQLQGVDDRGQAVLLTTTTDANGFYRFGNLRPGTYSIQETQPSGFFDGQDVVGSQGGRLDNDRLFDINLLAGVDGSENNFGELQPNA